MEIAGLAAAAFGSAFQEFLHWHNARRSLTEPQYRKLVRSTGYWYLIIGMILGSSLGTGIWFYNEPQHPRTLMLVGAAFPLLFKKTVGAVISGDKVTLGPSSNTSNYLKSA